MKMVSSHNGWMILSVMFLLVIIGAIIVIAYCLYLLASSTEQSCVASFGVQTETGGKILTVCGTNRSTICAYHNMGGLNGAIKQCNLMANICQAFIYDAKFDKMSIVDVNNTFRSVQTDLYIKQ